MELHITYNSDQIPHRAYTQQGYRVQYNTPYQIQGQQDIYGRGGGRRRPGTRGRGGRSRGGGQGGHGYGPPTAAPPPYAGAIPPAPTWRGGTSTPNPNKQYNNWNMFYLCGYDVPIWHTSATCDNRKHGHQVGCTRANVEQYTTRGHYVSTKVAHKVNLPVNPGIHQALQVGANAEFKVANNVNTPLNVYLSFYPAPNADNQRNNYFAMLSEEDDDDVTVWMSNKCSNK